MTVEEWIAGYSAAWENKDPNAVMSLFTADGSYHDEVFGEPNVGRDAIGDYWRRACSPQSQVRTRFGTPIVDTDQNRAAVEFWTQNLDSGSEQTLAGILYLRFSPEGLCRELREVWRFTDGHLRPSPNWGR